VQRRVACLALVLPAAVACRRPAGSPNLLVVTIDTLRADHCSTYGYARPTTPVLDRLAREGVLVEHAYAPMATTGPSHASMFTSRYPASLGYTRNGDVLEGAHLTLAERLRSAHYRTSAAVSSFVLGRRFGFAQGFGTFDAAFEPGTASVQFSSWEGLKLDSAFDRRANATTDAALAWLARRGRDRPFFLWVHYFDPHHPYAALPPFDARFTVSGPHAAGQAIAQYDGEVAFTDHHLGRLVDAVDAEGLRERTLVVVTADHGEGLMQHGHMGHGIHLYEEAVRVPLVFRWPGRLPAGTRLPGPAEHVDLVPTVLELMGLDAGTDEVEGVSLAEGLLGKPGTRGRNSRRTVVLQRRRYDSETVAGVPVKGSKFAVRTGSWKYIEAEEEGTRELFDLVRDPGETANLAASRTDEADRLSRLLAAWRRRFERGEGARDDTSPETLEALRALGYVQ
jgi:arylsulfatase A-like enzyme